jgi:hypothetical protein
MWQRPVSLKMSWDFSVLGRVMSGLYRFLGLRIEGKEGQFL